MQHRSKLEMKPVCTPCWKRRVGSLAVLDPNAIEWPPGSVCYDCSSPVTDGAVSYPVFVKVPLPVPEQR